MKHRLKIPGRQPHTKSKPKLCPELSPDFQFLFGQLFALLAFRFENFENGQKRTMVWLFSTLKDIQNLLNLVDYLHSEKYKQSTTFSYFLMLKIAKIIVLFWRIWVGGLTFKFLGYFSLVQTYFSGIWAGLMILYTFCTLKHTKGGLRFFSLYYISFGKFNHLPIQLLSSQIFCLYSIPLWYY